MLDPEDAPEKGCARKRQDEAYTGSDDTMPISIGAKPASDFSDPIGLLEDCHRRIERFLAVLQAVVRRSNAGRLRDEDRESFAQALDYFLHSEPRHTADEEESLFPRLRAMREAKLESALADMARLEAEHEEASKLHETVRQTGRRWWAGETLDSSAMDSLSAAVNRLSDLYCEHIALEEKRLFPVAAACLGSEDKLDIGREMAERREIH